MLRKVSSDKLAHMAWHGIGREDYPSAERSAARAELVRRGIYAKSAGSIPVKTSAQRATLRTKTAVRHHGMMAAEVAKSHKRGKRGI